MYLQNLINDPGQYFTAVNLGDCTFGRVIFNPLLVFLIVVFNPLVDRRQLGIELARKAIDQGIRGKDTGCQISNFFLNGSVQNIEGNLVPLPDFSQDVFNRHLAVIKNDLGC